MAEPQFYHWAAHITEKSKNELICNICKETAILPKEPVEITKPNDITRAKWIKRIRAIGSFVETHRICYSSSDSPKESSST